MAKVNAGGTVRERGGVAPVLWADVDGVVAATAGRVVHGRVILFRLLPVCPAHGGHLLIPSEAGEVG